MQLLDYAVGAMLCATLIGTLSLLIWKAFRTSYVELKKTQETDISVNVLSEECIRQMQIFWSAQLLEFRLNGMVMERYKHPTLAKDIAAYVEGACSAISNFYGCLPDHRDQMLRYSLAVGLKFGEEYTDSVLQYNADDITGITDTRPYKEGYNAADDWIERRKYPKERSLFNFIAEWGLVF